MTEEQIIEAVAQEFVEGYNEGPHKVTIDTVMDIKLVNITPRYLVTSIYNGIVKLQKK